MAEKAESGHPLHQNMVVVENITVLLTLQSIKL
jgi:hypothetical protein